MPIATVVIPTCNASRHLPALIAKLRSQSLADCEILVVDSTSDDQTVAIARAAGIRTIEIPRAEFDHGGTRTLAAKNASGRFVIFMTQDALPFNDQALEMLIQPLLDDAQVAAVGGRQIPFPDASLFAQHLRAFNYPAVSHVRSFSDTGTYGIKTAFLSNSFAAYRLSSLEEIGFFRNELIFGEDMQAAAELLLLGGKIAYAADAVVFHSHNYSTGQDFRRYFDMGVFHRRQRKLLDRFGSAENQGFKYLRSELTFLKNKGRLGLLPECFARTSAKFLGFKLGRCHFLLTTFINRCLSLNRAWWLQEKRRQTNSKA
jgi:rhamnosyltransferase